MSTALCQRSSRSFARHLRITCSSAAGVSGCRSDIDFGSPLTIEEIDERYPHEVAAWRRGEQIRRGGGELEAEVADRMVEVIERRLDDLPDKDGTLVVVTHGGAARVAIGRLLGLGPSTWWVLGPLSNCCWTVLGENQRGWRLLEHNAGTLPEPVLGDDR